MAENIYHLESKRVENLVFSQEIGGENGIFTKKRQVEILVFFKKVQSRWRKWSKIEVEKTVFFQKSAEVEILVFSQIVRFRWRK